MIFLIALFCFSCLDLRRNTQPFTYLTWERLGSEMIKIRVRLLLQGSPNNQGKKQEENASPIFCAVPCTRSRPQKLLVVNRIRKTWTKIIPVETRAFAIYEDLWFFCNSCCFDVRQEKDTPEAIGICGFLALGWWNDEYIRYPALQFEVNLGSESC